MWFYIIIFPSMETYRKPNRVNRNLHVREVGQKFKKVESQKLLLKKTVSSSDPQLLQESLKRMLSLCACLPKIQRLCYNHSVEGMATGFREGRELVLFLFKRVLLPPRLSLQVKELCNASSNPGNRNSYTQVLQCNFRRYLYVLDPIIVLPLNDSRFHWEILDIQVVFPSYLANRSRRYMVLPKKIFKNHIINPYVLLSVPGYNSISLSLTTTICAPPFGGQPEYNGKQDSS